MKKLITAAALFAAGTALASAANVSVPDSVLTLNDISLSEMKIHDISSADLSATDGFTLMLTISDWTGLNGPIGWLDSATETSSASYGSSFATFGWGRNDNNSSFCLSTYTTGGSATSQGQSGRTEAKSHGQTGSISTVAFLTVQNGTTTMYEIKASDPTALTLSTQTTGMNTSGEINSLYIGNWTKNGATQSSGTMDVAFYGSVLTDAQMLAIIPEPSAFGLLAGAGALALVAARRRRSRKAA